MLTDTDDVTNNNVSGNGSNGGLMPLSLNTSPSFKISQHHHFEAMDLFELFFNRFFKYVYLVLLSAEAWTAMWSCVTVAGVAWATEIPFHYIHRSLECSNAAFHHHFLPGGGCLYAYYLSITLFGAIVITLFVRLERASILPASLWCVEDSYSNCHGGLLHN